jgi:hypothetical protein
MRLEQLEPRDALSTFALADGVGYALDAAGHVARVYGRLVEPEAADVPFQVATAPDGHSVALGAGAGGGPRVIGLDLDTGDITYSVYVGDPESRAGVGVGWLPDPARILVAAADPELPGDPAAAQAQIGLLPAGLQSWLVAGGAAVDVFAAGRNVTALPRFAGLAGVPTPAGGDGDRTYDAVPAVAAGTTAYEAADAAWATLHELGHVAEAVLDAAGPDGWGPVWAGIDWRTYPGTGPTVYYSENPGEAFAESFSLWVRHAPTLQGSVVGYFDSLSRSLGWGA